MQKTPLQLLQLSQAYSQSFRYYNFKATELYDLNSEIYSSISKAFLISSSLFPNSLSTILNTNFLTSIS
jgi:hypothetical protein